MNKDNIIGILKDRIQHHRQEELILYNNKEIDLAYHSALIRTELEDIVKTIQEG